MNLLEKIEHFPHNERNSTTSRKILEEVEISKNLEFFIFFQNFDIKIFFKKSENFRKNSNFQINFKLI